MCGSIVDIQFAATEIRRGKKKKKKKKQTTGQKHNALLHTVAIIRGVKSKRPLNVIVAP